MSLTNNCPLCGMEWESTFTHSCKAKMSTDEKQLPFSTDAKVWAKEFSALFKIDESLAETWFANAIMAGYDSRKESTDLIAEKYRLREQLDSALAALSHLREVSQRVVDASLKPSTVIPTSLMIDLAHALSMTSGFEESKKREGER